MVNRNPDAFSQQVAENYPVKKANAIRKRIRTEPAYRYTSLCPDLALREAPKGVRRYYDPCRETPPGEEERKKSLHTICRGSSLRG